MVEKSRYGFSVSRETCSSFRPSASWATGLADLEAAVTKTPPPLNLLEMVQDVRRRCEGLNRPPAPADPRALKSFRIPSWNDRLIPILHNLIRGAIFTCGQREPREQCKDKPIYALSHLEITYDGEELRQRDYEVYMKILEQARGLLLAMDNTQWLELDARALIRSLRWTNNSRSLVELRATMKRFTGGTLNVSVTDRAAKKVEYFGPLIYECLTEAGLEVPRVVLWRVRLNVLLASQLCPGGYTLIDWDTRAQLAPLAKWIHAFYSSHEQIFAIRVEKIQSLCGSRNSKLKGFRRTLTHALKDLERIGFLESWTIDDHDKLRVTRSQMDAVRLAAPEAANLTKLISF